MTELEVKKIDLILWKRMIETWEIFVSDADKEKILKEVDKQIKIINLKLETTLKN